MTTTRTPKKAAQSKTKNSSRQTVKETPKRSSRKLNGVFEPGLEPSASKKGQEKPRRQPPRCNRCPGRPFRSQCIHTTAGIIYVREQEALQALRDTTPTPTTRQGRDQIDREHLEIRRPSAPSASKSPRVHHGNSVPPSSQTRQPRVPVTESPISETMTTHLATPTSTQTTSSRSLDEPTNTDATANTDEVTNTPSSARTSSSAKQVRTSANNPYHGYVNGAHRGTKEYKVVRGHVLPEQIDNASKSSRCFVSSVNAILERCEDVSRRTGCWIFLGAQHPTARAGAINYASPRLIRDDAEGSSTLATHFCKISNRLIQSKNKDTLRLYNELEESRKRAETMERALAAAHDSKDEMEAELEKYKEMYGILNGD